ncbi:ParB family protein [Xenorhabdus sp. XENO-1]|uniref:ParB family protein n=1 Tax=Xenorhabdus bovienii TaxID=40576 RepID=UPI0020CA73B6|nr:ParB family protein [Xenorhabdus bovienii]MCP9269652.1 ParB family protein [Xenorhabdus bovienii subsp. africana]
MGRNTLNLGNALLQQGRQAVVTLNDSPPMAEMPMVLTLDQLRPNPDNPRTRRNPRYDDIKASIKARGLDTVPKVTRDPDGDEVYIFSDGGNTRYQILSELWQETGDERFYRVHCLFKPWPGRLQCVIGHLAENELRGDLSFIEKALGVCKARILYEAQKQKKITQSELSVLLGEAGFPVSRSYISRMEDTVQYLYPWMPNLLNSGLSVGQIRVLLALRQDADAVWQQHATTINPEPVSTFNEIFGTCCRKFDAPEVWSPEMFRDELVGDLLQALPHPLLNYDRWILELDPKESNRRQLFGEQAAASDAMQEASETDNANRIRVRNRESNPRIITQPVTDRGQTPDTESAPVDKTQAPAPSPRKKPVIPPYQPDREDNPPESTLLAPEVEYLHFAQTGLEPVSSVWDISPMQDDIEHLQSMAFRLTFELTEVMGCDSDLLPVSDEGSAGFCLVNAQETHVFSRLLFSLTGENTTDGTELTLTAVLLGTAGREDMPLLDDTQTVKFLRLIRVLRRLRELQRQIAGETITMS